MMAAITAARLGADVCLVERNPKLGRKLYITGKGRCNVTNHCTPEEVLAATPRNGKFLYSAMNQTPPAEVERFFTELGVELKVERGNRVFPVSDRSADIIDALFFELRRLSVPVIQGRVSALDVQDGAVCAVELRQDGEGQTKIPGRGVVLGAGGTGAHIAPHLYRLLYALERPVKFIICDGDKVEPKNLVRQNFTEADLGENKARVIAERYSDVFGLETSYIPRFIEDAGQLEELLRPEVFRHYVYGSEPNTGRWVTNSELVILIGAVDNNKSRKLCHEVFLRARDLVYIDSGNGEYTGQIVCGIRRAGKTVYKPVGMLYPEVSTPEDLFPTEVSCAEASVSAPQTIVANLMAATAVVTMIYNILVIGCNTVQQTTFSTKSVNIRSFQKQPTRRKAA